jgi:hypothetical protein
MSKLDGELGILARRRIEAEIIKPIYDILLREHGQQHAAAVIGEAVGSAAVKAGQHFAALEEQSADLKSFVELQVLWEQDDALQTRIIASDAGQYDYDVTRCRYAEMYQEMGLGDIGHLLSCNRDELFITGYNPDIQLTRTQTIMGGATHCDFRYRALVKSKAPGPQS